MRRLVLTASIALMVLAGCGGTGASNELPKNVDHKIYAVCTGKPRFCAVAVDGSHPRWVSADELSPEAARRFRRLAGTGSVPLPP